MCQENINRHSVEILAPDGPHEVISIADELDAPVADLAAFKDQLDTFTPENYDSSKPYDLLVRCSQFAWNQFDQFATVLIKAAQDAGADVDTAKATVLMYRDIFIGMNGEADDILSAIQTAANDEEHKDQVSVLSIPCGSGKSTALTRLIYDVIQRDDGNGLIIVTDSVERMDKYWEADSANPNFDDDLLRFIARNQNQVAVINRQNYEQMRKRQFYASVVVLTTQRYFSWTPERVKELLRWEKGIRPLIVFDEAPYLSEERDITVETLNTVDAAIRMKIEATDEESRKAKHNAVVLWERIRKILLKTMVELEYTPDLGYAFIGGKQRDELNGFLTYLRDNRSNLDTNIQKIVQMAEDTARLLLDWGVYSHRNTEKSGKYESKFTVYIDHRDLLTDLGAKVIILDGTADVSPLYNEDYVYKLPNRHFFRSLSYLTIKLCDWPTGESDLRSDTAGTAKMIRSYLADATSNDHHLVIFSSEKMESVFRTIGYDPDHTGHFNNIKGLNSYSTAANIAQIGLNRKPPVDYLTFDLAHNEEVRTQLMEGTISLDPATAMNNARKELDYSKTTMIHHVLADMEQNMYRGIIRSAANTQPFTYYVFFDHNAYKLLIELIRNRYIPLGAAIEVVPRSKIEGFKQKSSMELRIAALENWFEHWDGSAIRQRDVYPKLGMSRSDFKNMLADERAAKIKDKLDRAKEKATAAGLKQGWLMK